MIIALPHMGNFEQAGAWVIGRGAGKFTTVAERLRPESVYESFLQARQSLGFEVLPLTGGGSPFGTLAQRLRGGGLVCLVSDRDLKESGVEVEMARSNLYRMRDGLAVSVELYETEAEALEAVGR